MGALDFWREPKTFARDRIRISALSTRWLARIDDHIRRHDIRGLDDLQHAASDVLDGLVFRSELADLISRRLLTICRYGFDDSMGRDENRYRDRRLCGTSWTVWASERLIRTLWLERLTAGER